MVSILGFNCPEIKYQLKEEGQSQLSDCPRNRHFQINYKDDNYDGNDEGESSSLLVELNMATPSSIRGQPKNDIQTSPLGT